MDNDSNLVFDLSNHSSDRGFLITSDISADSANLLSTSHTMNNAVINNISTHVSLLTGEYVEYLKQYTVSEVMEAKYYSKPEYYSLHKYGTRSMSHMILLINDVFEPMEFELTDVKYLNKEGVLILLSILTSLRTNVEGSIELPKFTTIKELD